MYAIYSYPQYQMKYTPNTRSYLGSRSISLQDKQTLLQQWVENQENCQKIEAHLQVSREQKGEFEKGRELLTIGEMQQRGFSQSLAMIISSLLVLLISLEHKWW